MAIEINFSANGTRYRAGLEEMRRNTNKWTGDVKKMIGSAFAAGAAVTFLRNLSEELDRIAKLASRLDITTDSLQRIKHAADLAGADLETTARALTMVARNAGEAAAGNEQMASAFEALGINVQEFIQMRPEEQLMALSRGLKAAEGSGQDLAAILDVMGRAGAELVPLLRGGPEALAEALAEANVYSEQTIRSMENFNDTITRLKNDGIPVVDVLLRLVETLARALGTVAGTVASVVVSNFRELTGIVENLGAAIAAAFTLDPEGVKKAVANVRAGIANVIGGTRDGLRQGGNILIDDYDRIWGPRTAQERTRQPSALASLGGTDNGTTASAAAAASGAVSENVGRAMDTISESGAVLAELKIHTSYLSQIAGAVGGGNPFSRSGGGPFDD